MATKTGVNGIGHSKQRGLPGYVVMRFVSELR